FFVTVCGSYCIFHSFPTRRSSDLWFSFFLPNRVYLERIESEQVNVTWRFRGERAGFLGTQLLITPHARDFEYVATGGTLKMALRSEEHTSELQSRENLVCRLLLEK